MPTVIDIDAHHEAGTAGAPRILFIGEALALSHVARPAVLAAHLSRQGYEVAFAADPRYDHLIPTSGLQRIRLNALPGSLALDRLARNEPVYDAETLDRHVQEDLRILRDFQPEIVVGDHRHSLAISAQLEGVPYINIVDAHWSPACAAEYELADSPLSRIVGTPLSNLVFQLVRPAALAFQTLPLNTVQMKYGLPGVGPDIKRFFTCGDHVVYPNDPGLFALPKPLPAGHRFIGPLLWSAGAELPEWWDSVPQDRPVVYVSLGSTGPINLLETLLRVLGEMAVTVVAVTAGRKQIADVPANVRICGFLPGMEMARRARLVICNGGSMSGQQALSAGTPYLGILSNMDQVLFTKTVHGTGACEWLRTADADEQSLRSLIRIMLAQDSYHYAARRLADRAARWDAPAQFENLVATIVRSRVGRATSRA